MSLLVQKRSKHFGKCTYQLKSKWYWSQVSCLKGNLIKVTYISPQEAVILLQKNIYVAKVVNMQAIWVI